MGYSEKDGVEAAGSVTHAIDDDIEIKAGVRKSRYGGSTVSVGLGADVGEEKDIGLDLGISCKHQERKPLW